MSTYTIHAISPIYDHNEILDKVFIALNDSNETIMVAQVQLKENSIVDINTGDKLDFDNDDLGLNSAKNKRNNKDIFINIEARGISTQELRERFPFPKYPD